MIYLVSGLVFLFNLVMAKAAIAWNRGEFVWSLATVWGLCALIGLFKILTVTQGHALTWVLMLTLVIMPAFLGLWAGSTLAHRRRDLAAKARLPASGTPVAAEKSA